MWVSSYFLSGTDLEGQGQRNMYRNRDTETGTEGQGQRVRDRGTGSVTRAGTWTGGHLYCLNCQKCPYKVKGMSSMPVCARKPCVVLCTTVIHAG